MVKRWYEAPVARRSGAMLLLALGTLAACSSSSSNDPESEPAVAPITADGVEVTNLSITPGNGSATASFTVNATKSTAFSQIVLAVRDASGGNFDFAHQGNVTFSGSRTFSGTSGSLPNGNYTAQVAYTLNGSTWTNVTPVKSFTIGAAAPDAGSGGGTDSGTTTPPPPGKTVVFNAAFTDTSQWTVGRTSSYPGATNPNDNKLDYISPSSGPDADGTFRATRRSDGNWDSDLVTTEYSAGHFELKPGDELDATVTLGPEQGAWPAIWTWGRDLAGGTQAGHGEVDLFEYHTNNPNLLELSNHVSDTHLDYTNANAIKPNAPFDLRVVFGSSSVDWYINGTRVFADGKGVPSNWVAYPIVNLSIAAGQYGHSAPSSSQTAMSYKVTNFRVYR